MPTVRRSRIIAARPQHVWEALADPHHMARWWPGVARIEGIEGGRFTQVHMTRRGRPVRIDFNVTRSERPWQRTWEQDIPGTPFARVLSEAVTDVLLIPEGAATRVTIEQRQKLKGYSRTGGFLLRRATARKLDEALEGLERMLG